VNTQYRALRALQYARCMQFCSVVECAHTSTKLLQRFATASSFKTQLAYYKHTLRISLSLLLLLFSSYHCHNCHHSTTAHSLLTPAQCSDLEGLVYPGALLRRKLVRSSVTLALVLPDSADLLLRSLAHLQDSAFGRKCSDAVRACEYVRLVGVLARETAALEEARLRTEAAAAAATAGRLL
jgi:hypothetical protein